MSTATGIAVGVAVSNANTAALVAMQEEQARKACLAWIPNYQHATATIDQMRYYATCIGKLYPMPLSADASWMLRIALAVCFLCMIGAVVWHHKHKDSWDSEWYYYLFAAFFGFVGSATVMFIGAVLVVAVKFVVFG